AQTASQLDYQDELERQYEKRIEGILSRVVGDGHVVAKVQADLDFSQVRETQTLYDPDGEAIRSTEKRNDSMNGVRPGPYGVAGAVSNQPGTPPPANGDIRTDTNKNYDVTNYEIPKTVKMITNPVGTIKRLSVAVLVDGQQVKGAAKGQDQTKDVAWSQDKLKEFSDL